MIFCLGFVVDYVEICLVFTATPKLIIRHTGSHLVMSSFHWGCYLAVMAWDLRITPRILGLTQL
ncbi:hypothetical protein PISMIDRAFT_684973, partial [Pisolithus microcarpus 441]